MSARGRSRERGVRKRVCEGGEWCNDCSLSKATDGGLCADCSKIWGEYSKRQYEKRKKKAANG